jgi:hypothetical protein
MPCFIMPGGKFPGRDGISSRYTAVWSHGVGQVLADALNCAVAGILFFVPGVRDPSAVLLAGRGGGPYPQGCPPPGGRGWFSAQSHCSIDPGQDTCAALFRDRALVAPIVPLQHRASLSVHAKPFWRMHGRQQSPSYPSHRRRLPAGGPHAGLRSCDSQPRHGTCNTPGHASHMTTTWHHVGGMRLAQKTPARTLWQCRAHVALPSNPPAPPRHTAP